MGSNDCCSERQRDIISRSKLTKAVSKLRMYEWFPSFWHMWHICVYVRIKNTHAQWIVSRGKEVVASAYGIALNGMKSHTKLNALVPFPLSSIHWTQKMQLLKKYARFWTLETYFCSLSEDYSIYSQIYLLRIIKL